MANANPVDERPVSSKYGRTGSPYTEADAVALYESNAPFRKVANDAAAALIGLNYGASSAPVDVGLDMAKQAAETSKAIAELMKGTSRERAFYWHPAVILNWLRYLASYESGRVVEGDDVPSPAMFAALLASWKEPKSVAGMFSRIASQLRARADEVPYMYRQRVYSHRRKPAKEAPGFRLAWIDVVVPYGAEKREQANGKAYFVAKRFVRARLDMQGDLAKRLFGELWISMDPSGRELSLVATKARKVTLASLEALLRAAQTRNLGTLDVPLGYQDRAAVKAQLDASTDARLKAADLKAQREAVAANRIAVLDRITA